MADAYPVDETGENRFSTACRYFLCRITSWLWPDTTTAADNSAADEYFKSQLLGATCHRESVDYLDELLNEHPDFDVNTPISDQRYTILHFAAWSNRCDYIKFMVKRGADPNIQSENGCTPLHIAALFGRYEVVEVLIEVGSDCNIRDNEGRIALEYARTLETLDAFGGGAGTKSAACYASH